MGMNLIQHTLAAVTALTALAFSAVLAPAEESTSPQFFPDGFALSEGQSAVVELFTSEGCSSCPPADKAIAELARQAKQANIPLVVLAWHVDYWDKLKTHHGVWKDAYSSPQHTAYQKWYLKAHRQNGITSSGNIFTPQVIVGGSRLERRTPLSASIAKNSTDPSAPTLSAELTRSGDSIAVVPSFSQPFDQKVRFTVALLQDGIVTEVTAGENFGKTLHHDNVVRSSSSQMVESGASPAPLDLSIPPHVTTENGKLVLLVHDFKTASVLQVKPLALPALKTSFFDPAPATSLDGLFPVSTDVAAGEHCAGGVCVLPLDAEAEKITAVDGQDTPAH